MQSSKVKGGVEISRRRLLKAVAASALLVSPSAGRRRYDPQFRFRNLMWDKYFGTAI